MTDAAGRTGVPPRGVLLLLIRDKESRSPLVLSALISPNTSENWCAVLSNSILMFLRCGEIIPRCCEERDCNDPSGSFVRRDAAAVAGEIKLFDTVGTKCC